MAALRELVGHEKIKSSLVKAISLNRVSHAYLFYGPPGVGKTTTGLAFARALLCSRGSGDACGVCDHCIRTARGVHPDLHLIHPDGATIKIRQLRALRDGAVYTSYGGGRQVFLVEKAEKMTTEAANSFLKTLEEPPPGLVFILVTDDPAGMPATVLSRCQRYRFNPLTTGEVVRVMEKVAGAGAATAAALSGGSPGRALALLDGMAARDRALDLLLDLNRGGRRGLPPAEELPDREAAVEFVGHLTVLFRDLMVWQQCGAGELLVNADRRDDIAALSAAYGSREVLDILLTAERTARHLAGNVNQRLALDTLLMKIAGMNEA